MTDTASSIKYRIQPVNLTYVDKIYSDGVFGDFVDTVKRRIEVLNADPTWLAQEKVRFFNHLLDQIDPVAYGALQDRYLLPPVERGCVKYLDPISWFEHKLPFAHLLDLHKRPPSRILDLGTGAGHFLLIARFYGHEVVGSDLPISKEKDHPSGFYAAMSKLFGTKLIHHYLINPQDLEELPKDIDIVTAFSVAFNRHRGEIWDVKQWEGFLAALKSITLSERGILFMTLMNKKVTPEVWSYLKDFASYNEDREKWILLDRFPQVRR